MYFPLTSIKHIVNPIQKINYSMAHYYQTNIGLYYSMEIDYLHLLQLLKKSY